MQSIPQVSKQVASGEINNWNLLSISNFTCNTSSGNHILVLLGEAYSALCSITDPAGLSFLLILFLFILYI